MELFCVSLSNTFFENVFLQEECRKRANVLPPDHAINVIYPVLTLEESLRSLTRSCLLAERRRGAGVA